MGNPGHRWPGAEETLLSLQPVSFSHIVLCTCDLSITTTFSIQQVAQVSPPTLPTPQCKLSTLHASLGKEPLPTQTASAQKVARSPGTVQACPACPAHQLLNAAATRCVTPPAP